MGNSNLLAKLVSHKKLFPSYTLVVDIPTHALHLQLFIIMTSSFPISNLNHQQDDEEIGEGVVEIKMEQRDEWKGKIWDTTDDTNNEHPDVNDKRSEDENGRFRNEFPMLNELINARNERLEARTTDVMIFY